MELKLYLRILLKRWWIVLAAFICTLIPTMLLVNAQPWIYETETTFVIRPRSTFAVDDEEIVKALDTISRRVEINTTFAEVSSSSLIKLRAIERLDLSSAERRGLKVSGKVIAGTNILEISVQGYDPVIVQDFANAVSLETLAYVSNLYDVFELEPLDVADLPGDPVSPNKPLNIALGSAFGLLLGVGLVFLLEYLREPVNPDSRVNLIDNETGAYNHTYFNLRLRQELSRATHNDYLLSLALISVGQRNLLHGVKGSVPVRQSLQLILSSLGANLREEDILAHLGDGVFGLLMPDMLPEVAKDLMKLLRTQIGQASPVWVGAAEECAVYCSIGLISNHRQPISAELYLTQALEALAEADSALYGKLHVPSPSDLFTIHANGNHSTRGLRLTQSVMSD